MSLAAQLENLSPDHAAYVRHTVEWFNTARLTQLPPDAARQAEWLRRVNHAGPIAVTPDASQPWDEFGAQAGRGFGKTRLGAEWLGRDAWEDAEAHPRCLIAPTQADARFTCFEGVSGLLNVIPPECVEKYNSSDLILTLRNGAIIRGFSAEKADRLRGPEHAAGWLDELAAWGTNAEDTFDMFTFGLRIGGNPRFVWTSTPKPIPLVRKLTTSRPGRIIVRGSTYDNKANLTPKFFERIAAHEGTRLGRQEIHGELIDPEEAGVIQRSWIRLWPHDKPLPRFSFIVVSLDTAFTEKTLDSKGDPDPTGCSVWGVFEHEKRSNALLLDCWEEHLGLPALVRRAKREMQTAYGDDDDGPLIKPLFGSDRLLGAGRKPDILLIEDKGSGISLRQSLEAQGLDAYAYNPGRADKLSRLHVVSPLFAQRRVWAPESERNPGKAKSWAEGLIEQLCTFTGSGSIKHDDLLDSTTQALRLCMDQGRVPLVAEHAHERRERELEEDVARSRRVVAGNPYAA